MPLLRKLWQAASCTFLRFHKNASNGWSTTDWADPACGRMAYPETVRFRPYGSKERIHPPFVVKLLTAHEYLRRLGVPFDLAIINESDGGYQQQLQDALRRAVEHGIPRFAVSEGDGTVAIIQKDQLPEEEWTLLLRCPARLKGERAELAGAAAYRHKTASVGPQVAAGASACCIGPVRCFDTCL